MALAGYLGRDAAGLGAAPPPEEPIEEDEEPPEDEPSPQAAAEPGAPNVAPPSGGDAGRLGCVPAGRGTLRGTRPLPSLRDADPAARFPPRRSVILRTAGTALRCKIAP